LNLNEFPPIECNYSIGDEVIFTNPAEIEFREFVIGFSEEVDKYGRFIHLALHANNTEGSAWWFPHRIDELTKYPVM